MRKKRALPKILLNYRLYHKKILNESKVYFKNIIPIINNNLSIKKIFYNFLFDDVINIKSIINFITFPKEFPSPDFLISSSMLKYLLTKLLTFVILI